MLLAGTIVIVEIVSILNVVALIVVEAIMENNVSTSMVLTKAPRL